MIILKLSSIIVTWRKADGAIFEHNGTFPRRQVTLSLYELSGGRVCRAYVWDYHSESRYRYFYRWPPCEDVV